MNTMVTSAACAWYRQNTRIRIRALRFQTLGNFRPSTGNKNPGPWVLKILSRHHHKQGTCQWGYQKGRKASTRAPHVPPRPGAGLRFRAPGGSNANAGNAGCCPPPSAPVHLQANGSSTATLAATDASIVLSQHLSDSKPWCDPAGYAADKTAA